MRLLQTVGYQTTADHPIGVYVAEMNSARRIVHIGCEPETLRGLLAARPEWEDCFERTRTPAECVRLLEERRTGSQRCGALLIGPRLGGSMEPEELAERALRVDPLLAVLALDRFENPGWSARLGRIGVADCLDFPRLSEDPEWACERIEIALRDCDDRVGRAVASSELFADLIGSSPPMREVVEMLNLIAPRRCTVLVSGPTGSGKELVAKAIHRGSPRAAKAFVAVNCGAVPAHLMESEFFGHVRGAFTGATHNRTGRFEQADRGTLFLDEVGELPLEMQSKLLRALQEREFQRVGSSDTVHVDVRVVAATNRDLRRAVECGEFREDLYYRLNVVPLPLPSLAERIDDLPALVEHLLGRTCEREDLPRKRISREGLARLMSHSWPGNVRQLENAVESAVALSGERELLRPSDFLLPLEPLLETTTSAGPAFEVPGHGLDYDAVVAAVERDLLRQALALAAGNKQKAADLLRIKRTTFAARWKALEEKDCGGKAIAGRSLSGALKGAAA